MIGEELEPRRRRGSSFRTSPKSTHDAKETHDVIFNVPGEQQQLSWEPLYQNLPGRGLLTVASPVSELNQNY